MRRRGVRALISVLYIFTNDKLFVCSRTLKLKHSVPSFLDNFFCVRLGSLGYMSCSLEGGTVRRCGLKTKRYYFPSPSLSEAWKRHSFQSSAVFKSLAHSFADFLQHFFNFLPLPQWHLSFGFSFFAFFAVGTVILTALGSFSFRSLFA